MSQCHPALGATILLAMKTAIISLLASAGALFITGVANAQAVSRGERPVFEVAQQLKNGEYVWAPELSPSGSALLVVNLATQRAVLFRNGVPMAASTISSGKEGNETPTGVFSILEKRKEHYSSTYNNAPMPNMQRLTWKGIALHAGNLPGYPASHGCIRLPMRFSELLFGATEKGMTVVITSVPTVPQNSGTPDMAVLGPSTAGDSLTNAAYDWHPERAPTGMTSVVVSIADQRAIVMRGGVQIGSAPVRYKGTLEGGMAYVVRAWDASGPHWLKLQFSGAGESMDVTQEEKARFEAPYAFRQAVAASMKLGSVIIVTPESLKSGSAGTSQTVIDNSPN
jgi:hypothetical protein